VLKIVVASPNLSLDRTMQVDSLAIGHVHRSDRYEVRAGGKGVNVVRSLDAVGVAGVVIGFAGGRTGDAVEGLLQDEGLDAVIVRTPDETRSCLTVLSAEGVTVLNETGHPLPPDLWDDFEASVETELEESALFVCSGSFPPGAPDDAAARLLKLAHGHAATVICDTSRAQLRAALAATPDVVVPNLPEALDLLEGTTNEPVDISQGAAERGATAARALVDAGARTAIVTLGSAGAVSFWDGAARTWPPFSVQTLNPVGAGDSLVAGLAWGLAEGEPLARATRRGLAMAAASCESFVAGAVDEGRYRELLDSSAE
jgi:1-phosphofructokinase family hexose kinase